MKKEELKNIKEYQHLKLNVIVGAIAMAFYIVCVSLTTIILLPFDGELSKGAVTVIIFVTVFVFAMIGPFVCYYAVKLLKIKRHATDYQIVEAKVSTSYLAWGSILRCAAYLQGNEEPIDFNVYVRMYEHGVEIKNGDVVQLWYNEANGRALYDSKK